MTAPRATVERGYAGLGIGLSADQFINGALTFEGGLKPWSAPVWIRALGGYGQAVDVEGGGDFYEIRLGVETRGCSWSGSGCGYVGGDIGYQAQTWEGSDEPTEHHHGPIVGARFGLDAGGDEWRFRIGVELYRYDRTRDPDGTTPEAVRWERGGGLSLALVRRL